MPNTDVKPRDPLMLYIAGLFIVGLLCATALSFAPGDHTSTIAMITGIVVTGSGFLIQHFKAKEVENKIDHNTQVTTQAAVAAKQASVHSKTCDDERTEILKVLEGHETRIGGLELQMTALKTSIDEVGRNLATTRHDLRNQLQVMVSKLDLLTTRSVSVPI